MFISHVFGSPVSSVHSKFCFVICRFYLNKNIDRNQTIKNMIKQIAQSSFTRKM